MDGEVHYLSQPDSFVTRVLCYPYETCSSLEYRLKTLVNRGFTYFLSTGKNIMGMRVLGRGYSSIVVAAHHSAYGVGALKLLRLDSRRNSLVHEAEMMRVAQPSGLPPRLYTYGDFYVFYELLPLHACKPYPSVLESLLATGRTRELVDLLKSTLLSLHVLDSLRVDHTEINRLHGHVFYCDDGSVRVLDWESARFSKKPSNVTSFVSYVLYRFKGSSALQAVLKYDTGRVLSALRNYKSSYSREALSEILRSLSLEEWE